MRLCEHQDFDQLIVRTAEHFRSQGFREEFIEKDYYAMEVLRAVSSHAFDKVIFKGGTSLSKAWGLIQRFSEDIDLFLDASLLGENPTRGEKDRALKDIRDAVSTATGMPVELKFSTTGFRRSEYFAYKPKFAVSMQPKILLEVSTASGVSRKKRYRCGPMFHNTFSTRRSHWGLRMKEPLTSKCCISGEHSLKNCSRFMDTFIDS